jgi:hypothetical protein
MGVRKRYCVNGHDIFETGRYKHGSCIACRKAYTRAMPKVPFAPLEAWLLDGTAAKAYDEWLARSIYRWRVNGIPFYSADRICCEVLGVHPHQVYGDAWFAFGEESATGEEHHGHDHTETHTQYQEVRVHA